jgi:hypothetical protein
VGYAIRNTKRVDMIVAKRSKVYNIPQLVALEAQLVIELSHGVYRVVLFLDGLDFCSWPTFHEDVAMAKYSELIAMADTLTKEDNGLQFVGDIRETAQATKGRN